MAETKKNHDKKDADFKIYLKEIFAQPGFQSSGVTPDEFISKLKEITREEIEAEIKSTNVTLQPKP